MHEAITPPFSLNEQTFKEDIFSFMKLFTTLSVDFMSL